ncbi:MAG: c-type cytochrome, partial [Cyclobacteriaceae bacterium]
KDPFVRLWTVRLLGDVAHLSSQVSAKLSDIAAVELHPEVRSQLAATAKRLPGTAAIPIIRNLVVNHDDSNDPDLPLQIWWALESKTSTDTQGVLDLFQDRSVWGKKTVRNILLERLMQRYVIQADSTGYAACARLVALAPSIQEVKILLNGLQEGLRGQDMVQLPPTLAKAIKPYEKELVGHSLAVALRQVDKKAIEQALSIIGDPASSIGERLSYIRIFGEINAPGSVPALLAVVENNQSSAALRQAAIQALQRYDDPEIGRRIVNAYPNKLRADPGVRLAALTLFSTRAAWAAELLNAIGRKKQPGDNFIAHTISKDDVPEQIVRQLKVLDDPSITGVATRLWPDLRFASGSEKTERISNVSTILQSGAGDPDPGRAIFLKSCGACHRLFDEGGVLGPDLTGYDRRNVNDMVMNIIDPNAYVREGYVTYRVTTKDGRILAGTIAGRSGTTIAFNLLSGERTTLPEGEVEDMRPQPSMMPDNLLEALTDQQVRDLFAYLAKGNDGH